MSWKLPSGNWLREHEIRTNDVPPICPRSRRPVQANETNNRSYVVLDPSQQNVLSYVELLFGYRLKDQTRFQPNSTSAVLTIFCVQREHLHAKQEVLDTLVLFLRKAGYETLFSLPTDGLISLGFRQDPDSSFVIDLIGPIPVGPQHATRTNWRPHKFDREITLGDRSRLFQGTPTDLASVRPCAVSTYHATTAYLWLSSDQSQPLGYFETQGTALTYLCGDLASFLPVIKTAFAADGFSVLTVPADLAPGGGMAGLGFRQLGSDWILSWDQSAENNHARRTVRELYDKMCRQEKEARSKLNDFVNAATMEDLQTFLAKNRTKTRPGSERVTVLDLLEEEGRAYCRGHSDEFLAIGVALATLTTKAKRLNWSALAKYAKQVLRGLKSILVWVGQSLGLVAQGAVNLLGSVVSACIGSAFGGFVCSTATLYLCAHKTALTASLSAAATAAGYTGPLGWAITSAVAVLVATVNKLCYYVLADQTDTEALKAQMEQDLEAWKGTPDPDGKIFEALSKTAAVSTAQSGPRRKRGYAPGTQPAYVPQTGVLTSFKVPTK